MAGTEAVLDLGCGRGLLLIGAARRLTSGRATGLDLWNSEDLTGNSAEATLANAGREGVADRVEVRTGDMRKMPFPDASFDVVVSNVAIHNIYDREGREATMSEIARVLKPGGHVVIHDIRYVGDYAAALKRRGLTDVTSRRLQGRPRRAPADHVRIAQAGRRDRTRRGGVIGRVGLA